MERLVTAPSGIVPIINTPFTEDMRIDDKSLQRLLDRGIEEGITGCIAPAVASEVSKLAISEREHLVQVILEAVGGRIPLIVGVSSESLRESLRLTEHALALGVDTVLCQVPAGLDGDEGAILAHFQTIGRTGVPLLMIQDLSWSGSGMRIELIRRMFDEIPAFRAIKVETIPAGGKYTAIRRATDGKMHVSCGWGIGQMVEAMERGVDAFTTTAINLPFVRIYDLFHRGDVAGANALFARIAFYLTWCQQHIDISIHFLKLYCQVVGVFTTANVREPIMPFDDFHRATALRLITEICALEDELRSASVGGE